MAAMREKRSSMQEATEEAVLLETSHSSARISAATAEAFSTTWMQLFSFWIEFKRFGEYLPHSQFSIFKQEKPDPECYLIMTDSLTNKSFLVPMRNTGGGKGVPKDPFTSRASSSQFLAFASV